MEWKQEAVREVWAGDNWGVDWAGSDAHGEPCVDLQSIFESLNEERQ